MLLPKQTYKDIVIRQVYDGLRDGKYAPGEKILENALALELGLSRAPIREALRELVSLGILEYRPQVGNFIATLTPEEIIDSYMTRGVLEGYAARAALPYLTRDVLKAREREAERMRQAAEKKRHRELSDLGEQFHREIFSRCNNRQLTAFTERLSLKLHLLFYRHWGKLYSAEEIYNRHMAIVDCLAGGDPENIERTIRDHYFATGNRVASIQQQVLPG